jgi:uncharacterized protein YsxB (DUF464 family)
MITILIHEDESVTAIGHAENKAVCGLFSGLITSIVNMFEMLDDMACVKNYTSGHFRLNINEIKTDKGHFLADGLINNIKQIASDYPESFEIIAYKKK